ncbi:MAG TPA: H+transporting two-sector ATPase C subunit [Nitrososphaeria archaeon]|nr:MAG: H+transporting two-sector ATPase C subunit [Nitrososphaerota archaeon]HDJ67145.1 H+transporting two-sector ATPase C subunit [Nitrososphaeria archaeon]
MIAKARVILLTLTIFTAILAGLILPIAADGIVKSAEVQAAEVAAKAEIELGKFLAMALSVSVCSVAAGYAVGKIGVAAIASAAEKPEVFGKTIIFAGLAEGIAIYGLLVAFLIWIS